MKKTSLSTGSIVYDLLSRDAEVSARATKIYPVVADEARLPYIVYRRSRLEHAPAKPWGADTVQVDVLCYAAAYSESVELAEAVRAALDYQKGEAGGIRMRSCTLADSSEDWTGVAYLQVLNFNIKIETL